MGKGRVKGLVWCGSNMWMCERVENILEDNSGDREIVEQNSVGFFRVGKNGWGRDYCDARTYVFGNLDCVSSSPDHND